MDAAPRYQSIQVYSGHIGRFSIEGVWRAFNVAGLVIEALRVVMHNDRGSRGHIRATCAHQQQRLAPFAAARRQMSSTPPPSGTSADEPVGNLAHARSNAKTPIVGGALLSGEFRE